MASTNERAITRDCVGKCKDAAYAAGLFEGEGCVSIRRSRTRSGGSQTWLAVVIKMADSEPLYWLQERWGGSVRPGGETRPGRAQTEQWAIVARKVTAFLSDIQPYLLSAKRRAAVAHALAFQAQKRAGGGWGDLAEYQAEQERFRLEMRRLNQRVAV
jgi:hypothetical protein